MLNSITSQPYRKYFTTLGVRIPPGRSIQFRIIHGQWQVVIVIANQVGVKHGVAGAEPHVTHPAMQIAEVVDTQNQPLRGQPAFALAARVVVTPDGPQQPPLEIVKPVPGQVELTR